MYKSSNNFDILRLFLASLVMVCHANELSGHKSPLFIYQLSDFAVKCFFVVSGFLITWSINRKFTIKEYIIKRFFRIYPLYILIILLQSILLYIGNSNPGLEHKEILLYFLHNGIFLNYLSPTFGNYLDNTFPQAMNGSLWTLKIEVVFYMVLPFIVMLFKKFGILVLIILFLGSLLYYSYYVHIGMLEMSRQLPGQMSFFTVGIFLFYYGKKIFIRNNSFYIIASIVILSALAPLALFSYMAWYSICTGVIFYYIIFHVRKIHIKPDISYGTYLLHFPICQIIHINYPHLSFLAYLTILVSVVLLLSYISAVFFESKFINFANSLCKKSQNKKQRSACIYE